MRPIPKNPKTKPWQVKDVRNLEVALSEVTTCHLHIEFDHSIRIVSSLLTKTSSPSTPKPCCSSCLGNFLRNV